MNLLITGAWKYSDVQLEKIKELGHNLIFLQNEKDTLPCPYEDVEGVICNGLFLYHPIEKFTSIKYIQITSAGYDRVPMDYINEHKIEIHNARGVYSIPMAEFALCGVLDLYKNRNFFIKNQLEHKWQKQRDINELYGKTVLIVGCGSVGDECAKRFKAFGCTVLGVDLFDMEKTEYEKIGHIDELPQMLKESDVVVLTLPLTDKTKGIFDAKMFDSFKDNSVFVNIARGALVNENDLISAIKTKLLGAVLDVFEKEPLQEENELWELKNVILTPHNSFVGEGNNERLFSVIYENIASKGRSNV